jgi:hypothetical protein
MQRYNDISEVIYGYLENMLMDEGASTWDEYKEKVGSHIGPYDKELWELSIKLDEYKKAAAKDKVK